MERGTEIKPRTKTLSTYIEPSTLDPETKPVNLQPETKPWTLNPECGVRRRSD